MCLPSLASRLRRFRSLQLLLFFYCAIIMFLPLYRLRQHTHAGISNVAHAVDDDDGDNAGRGAAASNKTAPKPRQHLYDNTLYNDEAPVHAQYDFGSPCRRFPNTDGIQFVMKTGATEAYDKLPTQLLTSVQCLPDVLLFSDLEQQMGKYHVYNVLDDVTEAARKANQDFDLYETQQRCPVAQKECTAGMGQAAWTLDKYKFVHMLERAWQMRPGRQWYVFAEADSYVFWSNLVQWLRTRADAGADLYVGSVALADDFPFAHGGSGYVISGRLVERVVNAEPGLAARYDVVAGANCCGDVVMAKALRDVGGAPVQQAYPMFNGDPPSAMPFDAGRWCQPIFTLHHMSAEEVSQAWQFEQTRTKPDGAPIQIRDVYQALIAPRLLDRRDDWDNLSDDACYAAPGNADVDADAQRVLVAHDAKGPVERRAHKSPAACAAVCAAAGLDVSDDDLAELQTDDERADLLAALYDKRVHAPKAVDFQKTRACFQWRYRPGVCCTSRSIKLGRPHKPGEKRHKLTSGWFLRGIRDWVEARGECEPEWVKLQRFD